MPPRNVVLTSHHQGVIDALVRSGRYQNASEVLRDGLCLVEEREAERSAKLAALRPAAETGCADLEAGRFSDLAEPDIEGFVAGLGRSAAQRTGTAGK